MVTQPELQERVFTPRELAYCRRRKRVGEHLAGRWAAKEAVLKCLGTGMARGMEWTDIEVVNDRGGRPSVRLYGQVEAVARSLGMHQIEISLSHSGGLAVAHAVMVCLPDPPDTTEPERTTDAHATDAAATHTAATHTEATDTAVTDTAEGDERHEA